MTTSSLPPRRHPLSRGQGPKRSTKRIPRQNAKRVAKSSKANTAYIGSVEWRDIKKRTHEVDGYQCTRIITIDRATAIEYTGKPWKPFRCPERGEVVNGKQTARGLVCDEITYRRRGDGSKGSGTHEPGVTTRTLCPRCNAIETTSKRANWMNR